MSTRTKRPLLRIDDKTGITLGGGAVIETGGTPAGPGVAILGAPVGLNVSSTALVTSDLVPSAVANLGWRRPATPGPVQNYVIQWSRASNFTNPTALSAYGETPTAPSITTSVGGLPCGVTIYFRVAAIAAGGVQGAWSSSVSTVTPADTTPPAAPTSLVTSWNGATGDLLITWTNPTSLNLRDVRVRIYASNGGALLRETYTSAGRFLWTRSLNLIDTSNSPDPSVYVVLTARSVGGTLSATDLTGTATLAAPSTPTGLAASWGTNGDLIVTWTSAATVASYTLTIDGVARTVIGGRYVYPLDLNRAEHSGTADPSLSLSLVAVDGLGQTSTAATTTATLAPPSTPAGLAQSWSGDTGTAAADLVVTWTAVAGLSYTLTIDGVARSVPAGRYVYPLDLNRSEHSGTPDPVLSLSLVAVDALGQSSTAATATATNAAPPATTLTAFAGAFQVGLTITASAAADLQDYRIRVYRNTSLVRTFYVTVLNMTYTVEDGDGSYQFDVSPRDRFGQIATASAQTAAVSVLDQAQFLADLRVGAGYRDSVSTSPTTLGGLKDGDLATNVVTYALSASAWRWTEQIRALSIRHRKTVLVTSASASYYFGHSADGTTYTWYAGGAATGGVWSPVAQASEAAAQTAATVLAAGTWVILLPATVEGRFFRIGHRNVAASYAFREYFPRSLVEADDVYAENLAAISANLGAITAGSLSAVDITGSTITGSTIRTNATTTRVEMAGTSLKAITSGATRAELLPAGLFVYDTASVLNNGIFWRLDGTSTTYARAVADSGATRRLYLEADGASASNAEVTLRAAKSATGGGDTAIEVTRSASGAGIGLYVNRSGPTEPAAVLDAGGLGIVYGGLKVAITDGVAVATPAAGSLTVENGLIVGDNALNPSGAPTAGQVFATFTTAATNVAVTHSRFAVQSSGLLTNGFGGQIALAAQSTTGDIRNAALLNWSWVEAADATRKARLQLYAYDTAAREAIRIEASGTGPRVGFLGAAASDRSTVTALSMSVGTGDNTVADVGAAFNQTTLNNNFRDLVNKVNELRSVLVTFGLVN